MKPHLDSRRSKSVPPARVQRIGLLAQRAVDLFLEMGLRNPEPNGRLRIRICDVTDGGRRYPGATNAAWDHVRINGAYLSSELVGAVAHEVFHRCQYRYNDSEQYADGIRLAVREGGARFAENIFNGRPHLYLAEATPIFVQPWRSFGAGMAQDDPPYDYEAALLWRYLAEQYGLVTDGQASGMEVHRALLLGTATLDENAERQPKPEATEPFSFDPRLLRSSVAGSIWYGHFDRFLYLDADRREVVSRETTWGNWLVANYLRGMKSATEDRRFQYQEDNEAAPPRRTQYWTSELLHARVLPGDAQTLGATGEIRFSEADKEPPCWGGARYYRVLLTDQTSLVKISVATPDGSDADPLTQVLLLDHEGRVRDIVRSDQPRWTRTINAAGLQEVVVVIANRERGGQHSLTVRAVENAPLVSATRWNCRAGTELEVDPRGWSWTWLSPDVMVDTDRDGIRYPGVLPGVVNRLRLRLRNRGNAPASDIRVKFWCQPAGPQFSSRAWTPVAEGSCARLKPNDEEWVDVEWLPPPEQPHLSGWCIKADIVVPNDPNTDDKTVLSGVAGVWDAVADEATEAGAASTQTGDDARTELRLLARTPGYRCTITPTHTDGDATSRARTRQFLVTDGIVQPADPVPRDIKPNFVPSDDLTEWNGQRQTRLPEPKVFYPVVQETLPENLQRDGVTGLATLVSVVDGLAVCGATFILPERRGK